MSSWLQWIMLTAITGNPLVSAIIVLCIWWIADRYTFGFLPDPFKKLQRFFRRGKLERALAHNPSDRRTRLELAVMLVERGRYAAALPLLKHNIEAGDEDSTTLFSMAQACFGLGHTQQGDTFLDEVLERDPNFRMGEAHLERARWQLERGDAKAALDSLETLLCQRPGSVEGKVLLSRAHEQLGDDVKAAYAREDAWKDFTHSPRFQRRRDRFWAWRAKPTRPMAYLAAAVICGVLFAQFVAPVLKRAIESSARPVYSDYHDDSYGP